MLRLIIADDEKIIRETISASIDWEGSGFEVACVCKDGIETYNAILDEYPDVVLTDIKMPGLSGLELIREIRKIDRELEFVILSGYGEFEFAKQAMECGVRHYLLKPVSEEKILAVMESVREECLSRRVQKQLSQRYYMALRSQLLIESFVLRAAPEELARRYEGMLGEEQPCFALFYVSYLPEESLGELEARLEKMGLRPFFHPLYVRASAALIFNVPPGWDGEALARALRGRWETGAEPFVRWRLYPALGALFSDLVENLGRYDRILLLDGENGSRELSNLAAPLDQADEFLSRLDAPGAQAARETERLFSTIQRLDNAWALAVKIAVKLAPSPRGLENGLSGFLDELFSCGDVGEVARLVEREAARQTEEFRRKDFVDRAISYVKEHLQDGDLSLKWIAEHVLYLSVGYLSKQFFKETGEKFSSFLTRLRIERAKELLENSSEEHIYEVAQQVGFADNPRYFSQLFKKCTGLTPTAFIARAKREADEDEKSLASF